VRGSVVRLPFDKLRTGRVDEILAMVIKWKDNVRQAFSSSQGLPGGKGH
jgi:hypothetical protein